MNNTEDFRIMKKPIYTLYPHIYCSGTILVNDVPVMSRYGEQTKGRGGLTGDVHINQVLLKSGKYKVVGKMYPRYGNETLIATDGMMIDFYVAESELNKWKESRHKFHPTIESPWNGLSEGIKYPYYEIATEIEVELPFVLDGWQNSVDLTKMDKEELFKDVLAYYQRIRLLLEEHNAAKYLELSQEKLDLQATAFYFDAARKQSLIDGLGQLFSQNLEALPLDPKELKMEIMGHGKLVRLMRKDHTEALQFKSPNPEKQGNVELEVKLHMRSKAQGFSII